MSALDCCGLISYYGRRLGLIEQEIDIEEASRRINQESKKFLSGDRKQFWVDFTQQPARINQLLQKALDKFQEEGIQPEIAIELGCGNSMSAIYLLQKGWTVIAVDNSPGVLDNLRKQVDHYGSNWLLEGQLTLVCQDMETYQFPKCSLILATDALPYCDPIQIKKVWGRAYDALEKNGRIVGNFFPNLNDQVVEKIHRAMMCVWFTDKAVVHALLKDKGYKNEICNYNKYWFQGDPRCIEFMGQKV